MDNNLVTFSQTSAHHISSYLVSKTVMSINRNIINIYSPKTVISCKNARGFLFLTFTNNWYLITFNIGSTILNSNRIQKKKKWHCLKGEKSGEVTTYHMNSHPPIKTSLGPKSHKDLISVLSPRFLSAM